MTLEQYVAHYLSVPGVLWFALFSLAVTALMQIPTALSARKDSALFLERLEMYCEMIYSATAMLFFIGVYFLISYRYFDVPTEAYAVWNKYEDLILLAFLVFSIMIINLIDSVIVPLRTITGEHKASLRMMAMIYMLLIFAYIKFVYKDNNYDAIISYFILMVIGRFVYFDASFMEFVGHLKNLFRLLPVLIMALLTSGLMAWFGFATGYLLKKNGVVLSVGIAHLFVIFFISLLHHAVRILNKK